jgi:hypothetical protein
MHQDEDTRSEQTGGAGRAGVTIRARHLVAAVAATAILASGVGAFAADAFSDVPSDHAFHDEIGWMADTGISEGYLDGTYRPTAPVSRQAMSAFMQRLYNVQAGTTRTATQTATVTPTLWTAVPGLAANVTIPPGTTGRIVVNTSLETACSGGSTGTTFGGTPPSVTFVDPVCQARVSLNSVAMNPAISVLDSSDGGTEGFGSWESHGMVRVSDVLPAGTHYVSVEVKALSSGASGYAPPTFRVRNGVLSAHVAFEDA